MAEQKSSVVPDPESIQDPVLRLHAELRIFRHAVNNVCHLLMMNAELCQHIPDRSKVLLKLVTEKMPELQSTMMSFSRKFEGTLLDAELKPKTPEIPPNQS